MDTFDINVMIRRPGVTLKPVRQEVKEEVAPTPPPPKPKFKRAPRRLPIVQDSAGNSYSVNKDITGKRFGHLTVLYLDWVNDHNMKYYRLRCDCGNEVTFSGHQFRQHERWCCSKLCRYYHEDIIDKERPGLRDSDPKLFHSIVMKHALNYRISHAASVMATREKEKWEAMCNRFQTDLIYAFQNPETMKQVWDHTYKPRRIVGIHAFEDENHTYKDILAARMPTELIRRREKNKRYKDLSAYIAKHYKSRHISPRFHIPQKLHRRAIGYKNTMPIAEINKLDLTGKIVLHNRVLYPARENNFQITNCCWKTECIFCKRKFTIPARLLASGGFRACRCLDLKLARLEEQIVADDYHNAIDEYHRQVATVREARMDLVRRRNSPEEEAYRQSIMENGVKRLGIKSDFMEINIHERYLGQLYYNYLFNLNDIAMLGYNDTAKVLFKARRNDDTKTEKKCLKQLDRYKTLEQYTNDMYRKPFILQDKNFGSLHVLRIDHIDELNRMYWLCECRSCGKQIVIDIPALILHHFRGCKEGHEVYDPVEEKYRPTPEEKSRWL